MGGCQDPDVQIVYKPKSLHCFEPKTEQSVKLVDICSLLLAEMTYLISIQAALMPSILTIYEACKRVQYFCQDLPFRGNEGICLIRSSPASQEEAQLSLPSSGALSLYVCVCDFSPVIFSFTPSGEVIMKDYCISE